MLHKIVAANLEATYKAFKSIVLDRNYDYNQRDVSWPNYIPGISKQVYSKQYEHIVNNRQFSFLLKNKSAIQTYYNYDDNGLRKIRLAYYPAPETIVINQDEADEYLSEAMTEALEVHYMLLHELMGQNISVSNTTHVRLDYDREVTAHSKSHLQIDGIQELRIPITTILTPFHFMDFIAQNLFQSEYIQFNKSAEYVYLSSASKKHILNCDLEKDYSSIFLSI